MPSNAKLAKDLACLCRGLKSLQAELEASDGSMTDAEICAIVEPKITQAINGIVFPPDTDTDEQRLLWDPAACELDIERGGTPVDISPTTTTGTRAQIKALMNSGSLKPGRQYCITGYARGCITDGKVFLTAQDTNMFSMDASILTEHDNVAWEGRYDCNTGRILELWDNRDNHAQGANSVDDFPWGNANWREVQLISADLVVECDTTLRVFNSRFESDSAINLSGTTGLIYNTKVGEDAQLTLTGAAVTVQQLNMSARSRILGNDSTAVIIQHTNLSSDALWDFRGQNDVRSVGSNFASTSRVYYRGGDRQWFYYWGFGNRADFNQTTGTIQFYYGSSDDFSDLNMNSADVWLEYGSHYGSRSFVNNNQAARVRGFYNDVRSRSEINYDGDVAVTTYYLDLGGFSRLYISGTANIVYAIEMNSQGIVRYSGGNHYRDRWTQFCDIRTAFNTRSASCDGRYVYTLTVANTNRASNYHHAPGSPVPALQ